ncbi:MAG: Holliday junction resolvase RuvX [Paludibacteraceae bacterium]|jgi:putative Holliday junction resolvase|nr:Holliday junction resolvase RuvX [Paludibacteraceae bacterium]
MGRILAIDYGKRRTGLAVTDMLRITANPLLTIDTSGLLAWLVDYTRREQVDTIVIGYPRQMNGSESETVPAIRACEQQIRSKLPDIPVVEFDERFTSVLAHQAMIAGGMKKKDRQNKMQVDKLAACIILESYLDSLSAR